VSVKPYLIGIAGPSCAGKSYLSAHIVENLDAVRLCIDSYYRGLGHLSLEQRAHWNFDSPDALDSEALLNDILRLAHGEAIDKPIYDFSTHSRLEQTQRVEARPFVIIEGLFALLWEEARKLMGTMVYVDLDEQSCLERRIERDIRERGRTRESVLEQYNTTVLPMARQHLYPTRKHAHLVVAGNDQIESEASLVLEHITRTRNNVLV